MSPLKRFLATAAFGSAAICAAACGSPVVVSSGGPGAAGSGAGGGGGPSGGGSGGTNGGGAQNRDAGAVEANFGFRPSDAGAVDVFNPTTGTSETNCGLKKYELARLPPEVLLIMDRSSTMSMPVTGSLNSRWQDVSRAVDGVVMATDRNVMWGMKMFPTTSGCMITPDIEVPVALTNYAMMSAAMRGTAPNMGEPGTPMVPAIRRGAEYLLARPGPNPRYLLLATDGLPNCGTNGTYLPNDGRDIMGPLAEIRSAAMRGIRTFVVGIAAHIEGPTAEMALDMWAGAGGVPRPGTPRYYPVNNQQDLTRVLNDITVRVGTCIFPLDTAPPSPMDVAVDIDGRRIPRDPMRMNGWDYGANMQSIEVFGMTCENLKAGKATNVQIIYGCPNMPIP